MSSTAGAEARPAELTNRLGYLLKHAQIRLSELTAAALEPFGLDGRELAVLIVLAEAGLESQQEAARRLRIDRTTMVAFVDVMEGRGLVERRTHAGDRRKNVVVLTDKGRDTLERATKAADAAEQRFLAPLTKRAGQQLKSDLLAVIRS
jgi:DNA-binding MarR family transcriptional regulator